jgi:hypothetical protein
MATPPSPPLKPRHGPCQPYITVAELKAFAPPGGPKYPDGSQPTDAEYQALVDFVTEQLWNYSGRKPRFAGLCSDQMNTLSPGLTCWFWGDAWCSWFPSGGGSFPAYPIHDVGGWLNLWQSQGSQPSCLRLAGPIDSITEVWVDGVELVAGTDYLVDGWAALCRVPRNVPWPFNTDPTIDRDQPGSFFVKWVRGETIPAYLKQFAAVYAVNRLAIFPAKILTLCNNFQQENIGALTADGVNVNVKALQAVESDIDGSFKRTGITIIDEWLNQVNPRGRRGRRRVYDARDPSRQSRRWTS